MERMFNGDKQKTSEYCLTQFETFLRGLREWDWEIAIHDAEIHSGVLFLCEDKDFAALFRKHWSTLLERPRAFAPSAIQKQFKDLDIADILPDLVHAFCNGFIGYMETYKGKLTDKASERLEEQQRRERQEGQPDTG